MGGLILWLILWRSCTRATMLWKYFAWMCSALCVGELSAAPGLGSAGR